MTTDPYQALASVVLAERPLDAVLTDITQIAQSWLPGAESTSITLLRGDRAWTAAYSSQLALDADEMQYREGFGPCMDAGRTGMRLVVRDMRTEQRWPGYAPAAVERGVRSSLSVPLPFQSRTIGALNNYSTQVDAFNEESLTLAEGIATHIGIAVMNADAHADATATVRQMQEALESRKVIDMALGILISAHHCSPDEAFEILVRTSQSHNRKLRDLARTLVEAESAPPRSS
jgi:GAF domain-containing protein